MSPPPPRLSRRRFLGYTAVFSGATLLAACAPAQAPVTAPQQPSGGAAPATPVPAGPRGSITYAAAGLSLGNIDPHNVFPPADFVTRVCFDPLLAPDERGNIKEALAASYRSLDQTTWEFKLRPNVKFVSGNPLTAQAVKWNFDRILNPENKLGVLARLPTLATVEAVDDLTLRLTTKTPDPVLPRRLFAVLIVDPAEGQKPTFSSNPGPLGGTGLFKITAYDPGRSVTLEAVTNSWRGTPKLAKIEVRSVPELGTVIAGLRTGDIDLTLLAADRVEDMVKAGLKNAQVPQPNIYLLWLASNRGGPLADRRVREAINLALDREAIIKELYAGAGKVASQYVGEDGFGYNPNLRPYPYNPQRAKQLLAEAGYPNGFAIDAEFLGTSLVLKGYQDASEGYLREIGIRLNITPSETNVFVQHILQGPRASIMSNGVQYGPAFDADFSLNWFSSKLQPPEIVIYNNPRFQQLFDASRAEFDSNKRRELLQQAQAVLHEDYASVPVMQPLDNYVHNPRLENFRPHPVGLGYADWLNVSVSR
ncbi:MAG: ABC transporter substrate-binding protein [Dehalococcoidia bacterium]|nr:MAG: ABC transporter substrate-binding protein [Dehalococcoidia bacterium]